MKISLIQMNSGQDKAANIAAASALIEQAVAEETPDWVGLPECFDFLGGQRADKQEAAEIPGAGPAYRAMQELARRHRIFIHAGSILEKIPGDNRIHNTTVVFDRDGNEIARYRKIHMFDITAPDGTQYRESASFKPGEAIATYKADDFTFGCAICYDLRFLICSLPWRSRAPISSRCRRPSRYSPARTIGRFCAEPAPSRRRLIFARQPRLACIRSAASLAPPMVIRLSSIPGGM